MNKFILILSLLFLIPINFIYADTNGIWQIPEDLKGGIFGADEQPILNYTFINDVYFNQNIYTSSIFDLNNNSFYINLKNFSKLKYLILDGLDLNGNSINNVQDPVSPQDVATKNYVDSKMSSGIGVDIGFIGLWASSNLPEHYLWCDGSKVSQNDYPDLYSIIGNTYSPTDSIIISDGDSFVRNGKFTVDWTHSASISNEIKEADVRLYYKWRPSNYGSGYPNAGAYIEIYINNVLYDRHDDGRNTWLTYDDTYQVTNLTGDIDVTFRIHSNYGDRGSSVTINEISLIPTLIDSSGYFFLPDLEFTQDSNVNYIIRAD